MCWSLAVWWISVAVFLYTEGQTPVLGTVLLATLSYWGWGKADEETDLTWQISERERDCERGGGRVEVRGGCGVWVATVMGDIQPAARVICRQVGCRQDSSARFLHLLTDTHTYAHTQCVSIYPYFRKFPWVTQSDKPMHIEKQEKQRKVGEKNIAALSTRLQLFANKL